MTKSLHVIGVGHALVDIIAPCEEDLLDKFSLTKGTMRLTSPEEAATLYASMGPAVETSGGSAANTCAGIASLGGRVGFMGKVGRDQFAEVFAHDIRSVGVNFNHGAGISENPTGRCLILVTPDGERTMNTNLGAAAEFAEADLDRARSRRSESRFSHRRRLRPRQRHKSRFHAFRSVLRRPPSRGLPRFHPRPGGHRFRQ